MLQLPPQLPLMLPPLKLPELPAVQQWEEPWTIEKEDFDRGYVHVNGSFDRQTLFRLIGQLERMAASL